MVVTAKPARGSSDIIRIQSAEISNFFRFVRLERFFISGKVSKFTFSLEPITEGHMLQMLLVDQALLHQHIGHGIEQMHVVAGLQLEVHIRKSRRRLKTGVDNNNLDSLRITGLAIHDALKEDRVGFGGI